MTERTPAAGTSFHSPARVLLVIDQPTLTEVVKFALNHGVLVPRVARDAEEATFALRTWQPHLALIDMDIYHGHLMEELGKLAPPTERPPVIALTRRGDLRTTLAAFDWGVDDLLTVPFSPEELLARALAVMRR